MQWHKQVYVDSCLPFGLRSAPKLFNILADLVSWIATHKGISCILHYLNDFLLVGPPQSPTYQHNLETFLHLCSDLGIPEKIEGLSLSFLGIIIDTHRMETRLPEEKITRIQDTLEKWLAKKSATKRKILSLVGQLQHATKVVRCGRTFMSINVCYCSKGQETTLPHQTEHAILFRLGLVANLFVALEWFKYPTGFQLCTTHTDYYTDRCLRIMRLWHF